MPPWCYCGSRRISSSSRHATNAMAWWRECTVGADFREGVIVCKTPMFQESSTQNGIQTDGFQHAKLWGLSKLAILVHQQFWYTFGWFFCTQKGIKPMIFNMPSSGDCQNSQFWPAILLPVWVVLLHLKGYQNRWFSKWQALGTFKARSFGAPAATSNFATRLGVSERKGGFSKGGFCRVQGHAQGHKKIPEGIVHLALTVSRPREAYIFAKTPLKTRFLVPENSHVSYTSNPFFRLPEKQTLLFTDTGPKKGGNHGEKQSQIRGLLPIVAE